MRSSPSTPLIFTTAKNMGSLAEPWDGSTWLVDLLKNKGSTVEVSQNIMLTGRNYDVGQTNSGGG